MNWEMILSIERDKGKAEGRSEGKIIYFICQILQKLAKGKPEEILADEVEEAPALVHMISSIAAGMDNPVPEDILISYLEQKGKAPNT